MVHRRILMLAAAAALMPAPPLLAAPPENWDGLAKVASTKLDAVYLLPGADFRGYSKVMIDQPEVSFHKDWKRRYNQTQRGLGGRVSDEDIRSAIDNARSSFVQALTEAYSKAGYQVVGEPAKDVLRVSTAVVNISVDAPDQMTAGRSRTYSQSAGEATLILEARDSVSGTLMGRALDREAAGDNFGGGGGYMRNSVTNRADFEDLFRRWAKMSAAGLSRLKGSSPGG